MGFADATYRDIKPVGWRQGEVHGGGRRLTSRDPEFRVDPAELAAWTAQVRRSIAAYHECPNQMIRARLAR